MWDHPQGVLNETLSTLTSCKYLLKLRFHLGLDINYLFHFISSSHPLTDQIRSNIFFDLLISHVYYNINSSIIKELD